MGLNFVNVSLNTIVATEATVNIILIKKRVLISIHLPKLNSGFDQRKKERKQITFYITTAQMSINKLKIVVYPD